MTELAIGVVVVLCLSWVFQLLLTLVYASVFFRPKPVLAPDEQLGTFSIGIPLRGADPNLGAAIRSVLDQDYPDFDLHIIIDSREDPAWEVVNETVRELGATNVHVATLKERRTTCSLYASTLAQYLDDLDESCQLVAFADADMIVPRDWLRNMGSALVDPKVGATLGNRWYLPESSRWGSLVRRLWNAGAVVLMWAFEIPWTGALAMRHSDVKRAKLAEKLKRGMTEDVPVKAAINELGLKMKFVAQSTIPNREEIDLANCYEFIERQMLWPRLYHPYWIAILLHAVGTATVMVAPLLLAPIFLVAGSTTAALWVGCGGLVYLVGMMLLLGVVASGNRRIIKSRGEHLPPFSLLQIARQFVAIPLTQVLYAIAAIRCIFKREVQWRGVTYRIHGPWDIEVCEDKPTAPGESADGNMSL